MDQLNYQHRDLAAGRWQQLSFASQMGNIGSEVSRGINWKKKKKEDRMNACFERALELIDLSVDACLASAESSHGKLKELLRCREELCDYFLGTGEFQPEEEKMMRYFDAFAMETLVQKRKII